MRPKMLAALPAILHGVVFFKFKKPFLNWLDLSLAPPKI
jgi:hypothetical protein